MAASPDTTPNDCRTLAEAFPVLKLPAACCDGVNGITCRNNRIVGIALSSTPISSTIPTSLANLGALETLDLSRTNLTGPIPAELGSISTLTILNLSSNSLFGPIPSSVANLTSLRLSTFSVENNFLNGNFAAPFSTISNATMFNNCFYAVENATAYINASMRSTANCSTFYSRVADSSAAASTSTGTSQLPTSASSASSTTLDTNASAKPTPSPTSSDPASIAGITAGIAIAIFLLALALTARALLRLRQPAEDDTKPAFHTVDRDTAYSSYVVEESTVPPSPVSTSPAATEALAPGTASLASVEKPQQQLFTGLVASGPYTHTPDLQGSDASTASTSSQQQGGSPSVNEREIPITLAGRVSTAAVGEAGREARSIVGAMPPAEVAQKLLAVGVGAGLVSILQENRIDDVNLLTLTDADLVALGIDEWYSRDLILRTAAYILSREQELVEQRGARPSSSEMDEVPPVYSK
ncbi:hypothetical protein HDU96_004265 [Phlyctochytrium bullatum]|nr:hypothetical protein HDU96_004265 [Phlyctochytrium bullatum]